MERPDYPFASHFAPLMNGRMHYVDHGTGDAVVFAHGTPTWSYEFRHLIRALAPRWRCVAPDHLGFGLSDRPPGANYTPEAHAARFREFVDSLGLRTFALVVHDYGGPIALPLALEARVRRIVLINTWMWPLDDDPEMRTRARMVEGGVGRFLYRRLNLSLRVIMPGAYGDRRRLTREIHAQYLERFRDPKSRALVLWPLARAILGSSAYYASLWSRVDRLKAVPVQIIWGMKDTAFRPHLIPRWTAALPQARVLRLESAGHWPHEEAPTEVANAIAEFLSGAPTSPGARAEPRL